MSKRTQVDTETAALIAIVERLLTLDRDEQARIVRYLARRFQERRTSTAECSGPYQFVIEGLHREAAVAARDGSR